MLNTILEPQIKEIKKIIKVNTNVNIDKYVSSFLDRRIRGRMFSTGKKLASEYITFLKNDPLEALEFNASLSINVTEFFRDKTVWDIFEKEIIPEIIKQSNESSIKIWSAGCATGNEPYSLAMMFSNSLEKSTKQFTITATDMNATLVAIAQNGKYELEALKNITVTDLEKYLEEIEDGLYKFNLDLKKCINFQAGDIASAMIDNVDVITCRNLLIYYGDSAKDILFQKFWNSLKNDGFLVLGMFESIPNSMKGFFKPIFAGKKIFQKIIPEPTMP